jgi:hypothetical protein
MNLRSYGYVVTVEQNNIVSINIKQGDRKMKCVLSKNCSGTMERIQTNDETILHYWQCSECKETKIVLRTKEELIQLYTLRVGSLTAGLSLDEIIEAENLEAINKLLK